MFGITKALFIYCKIIKKQQPITMDDHQTIINEDIIHLASPVLLNTHSTEIDLNDYFIAPSKIKTIKCNSDFIKLSYNPEKYSITAEIINQNLPAFVKMWVTTNEDKKYCIILKKSQKIEHKFIYRAMTADIQRVQIAGDFNSWNPSGYDFHYNSDNNWWEIILNIEPGNYTYQLIANGHWFCDPDNPHKIDNGYGNFNSVLELHNPDEIHQSHIFMEKCISNAIVIAGSTEVDEFIVLWNNIDLQGEALFRNNNKLMISIPAEAINIKRSYIRVWAYNNAGISNDLLIPLEYNKLLTESDQLDRNDKESQLIYFLMVDRYCNGKPNNDQPVDEIGMHAKLNFQGGDIAGILKKMKDGYLTSLGINTLWVSPLSQNPMTACAKDGKTSAGYHGYWPVESKKVDCRFGTEEELKELVKTAHKHNINVILDFVSNHVHEDNALIKDHPDWCTPLLLADGSKNIGRWEDQRFTTWFDEFLPTLDYDNPEVVEAITDIALYWIDNYDLDGFRHDATKHIPNVFWKALTKKLKKEIMAPKHKRLYQIGETFGGRDMLVNYVNSGMLDGQFSFNLYYESRAAFAKDDVSFRKLSIALQQDLKFFGYNHLMGNITGNHDMPRFISYAGEDLRFDQNAEHEGWVRLIGVKNKNGYKKLSALTAFTCTIPGIPVIYYGDEIGIAGGGDPDNRRAMRFDNLNEHERHTLQIAQRIFKIRTHYLPLIYGDIKIVYVSDTAFAYIRTYLDECAIIIFNKQNTAQTLEVDLPRRCGNKSYFGNFGSIFMMSDTVLSITLNAYSFEIITTKQMK